MRKLIIAAAALLVAGDAAGTTTTYYYDGNKVKIFCDTFKDGASVYVVGVVDAQILKASDAELSFCVPTAVKVPQMSDVVCNYLDKHPETRHEPASVLAELALKEVWPCQK